MGFLNIRPMCTESRRPAPVSRRNPTGTRHSRVSMCGNQPIRFERTSRRCRGARQAWWPVEKSRQDSRQPRQRKVRWQTAQEKGLNCANAFSNRKGEAIMTEKQFANHAVKMWRAVQSINRALQHRTKPWPSLGLNVRQKQRFLHAASRLDRTARALVSAATK